MFNSIFLTTDIPNPYKRVHLFSRGGGYNLGENGHPMFQIFWITKGMLNLFHHGVGYSIRKGHVCLIPPQHRYSLQSEPGYEQLGISLNTLHDERGIVSLFETQVERVTVLNRNELLPMITNLENMHKQHTILAKIQMANLLDTLILSCVNSLDSQNSFRLQILNIMNHHTENPLFPSNLTLNDISSQMAISSSHLERMTSREFGCGVMELYQQLRFNKACSLIINSDLSMKQIAERLGFFDQAHFSRFFKQKMNVSPTEFRKTSAL